ncbi:hypothetical protein ACFQI7_16895 [Paenibacillus allorhizosphaerae]|uniref:Tetratricopeptide repeat protein n=1 Tax=Paenibacillus allorhizosphaerae TaxID=2849866 RepID=A0ABM8VE96_9BACL|nr:hypothetical protein [Paenibacillus allorhizosphaerae]CAG7630637.1 hypothetical protein PAECIP111802_01658 [Paenibacillus allorhizosphaerae]
MTIQSVKVSQLSASYHERLIHIIRLHGEGVAGNAASVQEANRLLELLRRDYPGVTLAEAYHGSTMILVARDATKPLDKLKWCKNGLMLLDRAVAAAPHDLMVRLLRGKAAFQLPEKYFKRTQTAIEDYTFLIDQELRQPGVLEADEYPNIIYELGEAYQSVGRNRDAVMCWSNLLTRALTPDMRQRVSHKLQAMEGKPAVEIMPPANSVQSILIGIGARATGDALQQWGQPKKKKSEKKRKQASRKARQSDEAAARKGKNDSTSNQKNRKSHSKPNKKNRKH